MPGRGSKPTRRENDPTTPIETLKLLTRLQKQQHEENKIINKETYRAEYLDYAAAGVMAALTKSKARDSEREIANEVIDTLVFERQTAQATVHAAAERNRPLNSEIFRIRTFWNNFDYEDRSKAEKTLNKDEDEEDLG